MKKLFYFISLALLIAAGSSIARATTFTVTKIADTNDSFCDADCSLREAISAANAAASDDVIAFDSGVFGTTSQTITLGGTPLIITDNGSLTIIGPRPDLLAISGNNLSRVFVIQSPATAAINNLTITGGNSASSDGGGIVNIGTTTITNCVVRNNQSGNGGGGIANINPGTLNIVSSTISHNTAMASFPAGSGGGIYNSRSLTIINSTISNNTASSSGGGIYAFDAPSSVSLFNTTIAFNSSQSGGGGVVNSSGTLTARNTLIGNNTDFFSPDFSGILNSQGYNLIENTDGTTITGTTTGNIHGLDPVLGPLGLSGGFTPTHALCAGSPAIDAAHPTDFPATDQRGITRPKDGDNNGISAADIGAFERYPAIDNTAPYDFDGDGRTDISIFRPSVGEWWILKSSNGGNAAFQFGNSSDKIVPADFTGDGKADVAVFRPSTGEWFILRSENLSFYSFPFGTNGDIPAPADYDGDNKSDAAVFRPSTATWFIFRSSGGITIQQFGANGDVPVVADYDGDGKSDIAIYRASAGEWWIQRSSNNSVTAFTFGNSSDKAVQGDYTGDGKADAAIFRPSTGEWFVLRSEDQSYYSFPFGTTGDLPAPGDFDGDGKFDAAVFRPSGTTWFVQRTTAGTLIQQFGIAGDAPVPGAFVP